MLEQSHHDRLGELDLTKVSITSSVILRWHKTTEQVSYWSSFANDVMNRHVYNVKTLMNIFWQQLRDFVPYSEINKLQEMIMSDATDRIMAVHIIRYHYSKYSTNKEIIFHDEQRKPFP